MKITITRSFSRTKQVAAFEPINSFCSIQMEIEEDHMPSHVVLAAFSEDLDQLARAEVEKTIEAEIAKRKLVDNSKIQDTVKVETQLDAGAEALDRAIDPEAPRTGYREI